MLFFLFYLCICWLSPRCVCASASVRSRAVNWAAVLYPVNKRGPFVEIWLVEGLALKRAPSVADLITRVSVALPQRIKQASINRRSQRAPPTLQTELHMLAVELIVGERGFIWTNLIMFLTHSFILCFVLCNPKQTTNKQTNRERQKHNLFGGGEYKRLGDVAEGWLEPKSSTRRLIFDDQGMRLRITLKV